MDVILRCATVGSSAYSPKWFAVKMCVAERSRRRRAPTRPQGLSITTELLATRILRWLHQHLCDAMISGCERCHLLL